MTSLKRLSVALAAMAFAALPVVSAQAQDYPSKPVTLTIGVTPGGAQYNLAQAVATEWEKITGQPMVIEPKPGANTIIQLNDCKSAAPDGYRICIGSRSGIGLNPFVYENLSYDPQKDLIPVARFFTANHILMVRKDVPADDWKGLVEYAKANPDKINYGSFGAGGDSHLFPAWMAKEGGAAMTHIPYQGAAPGMQAFGAGEIQMLYFLIGNPTVLDQYKNNEVKIMMVSGDKRHPLLPNVPSMVEAGLPAEIATPRGWFGIFAPAGTPQPVVDKINSLFNQILTQPEMKTKFLDPNGFDFEPATPQEWADFVKADRAVTQKIAEAAGVKLKQN